MDHGGWENHPILNIMSEIMMDYWKVGILEKNGEEMYVYYKGELTLDTPLFDADYDNGRITVISLGTLRDWLKKNWKVKEKDIEVDI